MKTMVFALCLLAPLAAGCVQADRNQGASPPPSLAPAGDSLLTTPAVLAGPGADAESSVDVSEDGQTILICSHGGFTQASPLWVSVDAGQTFKRFEPQPNQPFNGDCDVEVGKDGSWAITYDTAASATYASTTDKGATWLVTYVGTVPLGGVDRPWIETVGPKVFMNYKSIGAGQPTTQFFAVSADRGVTWVPRPFAPPSQDKTTSVAGDMFRSDDGRTVWIPLARTGPAGRYLELAVTKDDGATWTYLPAAGPMPVLSGIPSGDRAGDGTLYLSYTTGRQGKGDVMVVASKDEGTTWSAPMVAAANQSFASLATSTIDARPDGSATMVWMSVVTVNETTKWQPAVSRVRFHPGFRVEFEGVVGTPGEPNRLYEFSSIRHDAAGRAYVVYPLVTGPSCKQTPVFPSQVGSQNIPRNNACQYIVIEDATPSA